MNFSSSFSSEIQKTENGELSAQQVLARVAVRVYERAFPSAKTRFVSHAVASVRGLEAPKTVKALAYFKAGAMLAAGSRDSCHGGKGPGSRDEAIILFILSITLICNDKNFDLYA